MTQISNYALQSKVELAKQFITENASRKKSTQSEYKAIGLSKEIFWQLFSAEANQIIYQRGINSDFVVDDDNRNVILNLYYYISANPLCAWNLNAGLIFGGGVGVGKTIIMKAYIEVHNKLCTRKINFMHVNDIVKDIKKSGIDKFRFEPLAIDEFGRENSEEKDFGNIIRPMADLIVARYDAGGRTFATTNFKYDTFESMYKSFITDRLQEMCTYVVIPGTSRRIKNGVK